MVSGAPLHERQFSAPSFSKLDDDNENFIWDSHQDVTEKFRPASEVFYSKNDDDYQYNSHFDRRASMPSKVFEKGSADIITREGSGSVVSVPTSKKIHTDLTNNLCLNMNMAMSDPELAVRRSRTKNIKAITEDIKRAKSASVAQRSMFKGNSTDERGKNKKKLPKNLESWRARENSCDSASSSPGEERESNNSRKVKREDSKRYCSPSLPGNSPESPQNKQKRLSAEETEIAIAHSPIYLDDVKKQNRLKVRPLPITISNESDILRGLDLDSYDQVKTPDIVIDKVLSDEVDDSFDDAIERFNRRKKGSEDNFESAIGTRPNPDEHERTFEEEKEKKFKSASGEKVSDASNLDFQCSYPLLENDYSITVTGSVNDETLIMEDKDTGLDLSELMDLTNMKKSRKTTKQKGEKELKVKETTITFV